MLRKSRIMPQMRDDDDFLVRANGRATSGTVQADLTPVAVDSDDGNEAGDRGAYRIVDLSELLACNDDDRLAELDRVNANKANLRLRVDERLFDDLFEAVLALRPNADDMRSSSNFQKAALEAAVFVYPETLDIACGRIKKRMEELKIPNVRHDALFKRAKEIADRLMRAAKDHRARTLVSVRTVLPDAPVNDEIIIPAGWTFSAEGIIGDGNESGPPIPAPVIISGRSSNPVTGEETIDIAWRRGTEWNHRLVERAEIADARRLVGLAGLGLPVTSNSAKLLVQFLSEFEAVNLARLPVHSFSRQLGWQSKQLKDGFLLGTHIVTRAGMTPANGEGGGIVFRGADSGDEQIALSLSSEGSLDAWKDAIRLVAKFPKVMLGVYVALVPPMLSIVGSPNFVFDYAGETTAGKTTSLRIAGSVWGRPDESHPNSIVNTWDSTPVWRERAPATMNHLPFILDDTKRANRSEDVDRTIYDLAQGRARGRGSPRGLAEQLTWQTVLMTSGEQPATSFTQAGGTRARAIELWGSPFGARSEENGKLARQVDHGIKSNFGHAGPAFVHYLITNRKKKNEWKQQYETLVREYQDRAGHNPIAGRLATHFAVITVTMELFHAAIQPPWPMDNPIERLWEELIREAGDADRPAAAMRYVIEWASAHSAEFQSRTSHSNQHQPARGWAGVWFRPVSVPTGAQKEETHPWDFIGFYRQKLDDILREGRFEPDGIIRSWRDRGWLRLDKDSNRNAYTVRIGDTTQKVIAVTYAGAQAAKAV